MRLGTPTALPHSRTCTGFCQVQYCLEREFCGPWWFGLGPYDDVCHAPSLVFGNFNIWKSLNKLQWNFMKFHCNFIVDFKSEDSTKYKVNGSTTKWRLVFTNVLSMKYISSKYDNCLLKGYTYNYTIPISLHHTSRTQTHTREIWLQTLHILPHTTALLSRWWKKRESVIFFPRIFFGWPQQRWPLLVSSLCVCWLYWRFVWLQ